MNMLRRALPLWMFFFVFAVGTSDAKLSVKSGDFEYIFSGKFTPETFYGRNITWLNNNNCGLDQLWYARHTLDLSLDVIYDKRPPLEEQEKKCLGKPAAEFYFTIRDRAIWGNPGSIASTSEETFRLSEAVVGAHKHTIPRHIFWIRELWLEFDLATLLQLPFREEHSFKIGAFPFSLGRGIALGSAFATGPDILGYYSEYLVDQFAFGGNFSGHLCEGKVCYDLYAAILNNKSNRQWHAKPLLKSEINAFQEALAESKTIQYVAVHASYLINLGSPERVVAQKSTTALAKEIVRCEKLAIPQLVIHPGASLGTDEQACLERIAKNLDAALDRAPGKTMVLLENMAGQGSNVCYRFEQIAEIRKMVKNKKRVGVSFDTCHAFAAGYNFTTPAGYRSMWQKFDKTIGLKHLKLIHLNDSARALDSHVDRHANIGKGKMGLEPFRLIMNDKRFISIPKVLETPKSNPAEDRINMNILIGLIK